MLKNIPLPESTEDAVRLQNSLRKQIKLSTLSKRISLVAGIDCAYTADTGYCAVLILDCESWEVRETAYHSERLSFPYISGMLSFREIPIILPALEKLGTRPDLIYVDGQGIMHPRKMGLATHLGIITGIPSLGCAKSRLCGTFREPGMKKGDSEPVFDSENRQTGWVLRSRAGTRPLFVSPGQLVDMEQSRDFCLRACVRYRLPEPTRLADRAVAEYKKSEKRARD